MYCKDCEHVSVCKHYEYFTKYPGLHMLQCEYRLDTKKDIPNKPIHESSITLLNTANKNVPTPFKPHPVPKLNECPTCDAKTYGDLFECCVCGQTICSSCVYVDEMQIDNKGQLDKGDVFMCEHCYEERYEDEINKAPDNTSLFDVIAGGLVSNDDEEIELEVEEEK